MAWSAGFLMTQASTMLLVVLGAFALIARPHTRASRGFGWMGVGLAVGILAANVVLSDPGPRTIIWALPGVAGYLAALAGLWAVVTPEGRVPRGEGAAFAAIAFVLLFAALGTIALGLNDAQVAPLRSFPLAFWSIAAVVVAQVTTYGVALLSGCILLAIRYARAPPGAVDERARLALMAAGLGAMPAAVTGTQLLSSTLIERAVGMFDSALLLVASVAWLAAGARASTPRQARNVPWTLLTIALAGIAVRAIAPQGLTVEETGFFGVIRLVAFAVFGYAILHHQLLGLDVKVRFAISKSTIAAAFIAVFFVASEAAQQFFGATFASAYVGIAAAGMLVFAMAPLQRAAERLAEKAVPVAVAPPVTAPTNDHEEMYRDAARLALRDRTISRAEERHLFRLARGLGLQPDRAHEILVEAEREAQEARS